MTEEDKAVEYRRQQKARAAWKKAAAKLLAGDPARKRALEDQTKALKRLDEYGVPRVDLRR